MSTAADTIPGSKIEQLNHAHHYQQKLCYHMNYTNLALYEVTKKNNFLWAYNSHYVVFIGFRF